MDVKKKYYLGTITLEVDNPLELDEIEYTTLINAKNILSTALTIEEKYDIALCNYMEFEKEQLTITMSNLVNSIHFDYIRTYETLSILNRRLINFLSTGKKYTELAAGLAAKCTANHSDTKATISALLSKHYDESLDYRMMEALRNHVNHSGLAVHTVTAPSKWTTDKNNRTDQLVFNIEIYALKKTLNENSGFKQSVLNEIPDKFDLKKGARSYIGAISDAHEKIRETISEPVNDARNTISKYLNKYSDINNGSSLPAGIFKETPNTSHESPTTIFLKWDDVRVQLSQKNISISNMVRRHISSAIVNN